eukprot:SAG31_NODE_22306_length_528_cov_5.195804_1_plen_135_part_01
MSKTVVTFRTELLRPAEVVGWPTASFDVGEAVLFEQESVSNGIPAVWRGILSATKTKTLVASKVIMLPDMLGDGDSSPFQSIVTHCDASVFESKLLQLIVQSKWEENVRKQRYWSFFLYGVCFVEGAAAMMMSAK